MFLYRILTFMKNKLPIKNSKLDRFSNLIVIPLIIKQISQFIPDKIDEKLIIMGAYGGEAFIDNTKYLFKFLVERSNYKLVWITKSRDLMEDMKKEGYDVVFKYSLKTMKHLRRAKYIFLTHGHVDILPIKFSPQTIIILTWHGTPIKEINIDDKFSLLVKKWNKILRLNLNFNQYIDYLLTPAGGEYERKILRKAFGISQKKIISLGYPRNDILFNDDRNYLEKLKIMYEIPENIKKIIIYAPTFRKDFILKFPITNKALIKLNELLEKSNTIFLIKAHIYEKKIKFKNYKNIRLIGKNSDLQELLLISDILITDYSSVIFDYLLTMKPILLFTYDLSKYIKERKMYYNLKRIAPGPMLFNTEDLLEAIRDIEKIDGEFKEIRGKIRDKFNKYHDDKSTERILKSFNIKYN